jgi:polysaccharide export outer membrane protein
VLGYVNKPGIFPLAKAKISISEVLGLAGGVVLGTQGMNATQTVASAGDVAIISGVRNGVPFMEKISISELLASTSLSQNNFLIAGDVLYVPVAPSFFIYGQVNQPGMRKVEPNLNLAKVLAMSGGLTLRGTQRNIKVTRKGPDGAPVKSVIELTDLIQADDVIFVEESLF